MKATLSDKQEVAEGTLMVTLKPSEPVEFKPGQYMDIILENPPYNDERGPKRHFSIVNSPNQKDVLIFTTRLRDSAFKKSLQQLPLGTEVDIPHIGGSFTLPEDTSKSYVFIAGGIGITPFMSMIRYINEQGLNHQITLIYSNRNQGSSAFLDELQSIHKKNPNIKLILTMTDDPSWQGEKRRIDNDFIKTYFPQPNSYVYMMAGPPPMMEAVDQELQKAGVELKNIIRENFTGY